MTVALVTVLLICISHCVYSISYREYFESNDDIVECVFAIKINSSIRVTKQHHDCIPFPISGQIVQNIDRTEVQVKTIVNNVILPPCTTKTFYGLMNISNSKKNTQENKYRAIVYVSDCKVYIEEPEEGYEYDKSKVLWRTATLGVKSIPDHPNLSTLISTFWPEKRENVWQQYYAVIKDLLDVKTQQIISEIINKDLKDIKEEMVALNNITENYEDFEKKYMELIEKLRNVETRFELKDRDREIFNFYIIPLYTNVVTMKMYFYAVLIEVMPFYDASIRVCPTIGCVYGKSKLYFHSTWGKVFDEIYDKGYAGGLYNVMMNARSYFTWHALELVPKWFKVYIKCGGYGLTAHTLPLTYSNLYGRATPNLLEKSTHIHDKTFSSRDLKYELRITKVNFCIIETNEHVKTVYGLELISRYSKISMGNCKSPHNISIDSLDLTIKTIIKLKVYKTKYIRCLEFNLSDNSTSRFGDNCEDNSENSEFYLEGHYIQSLYLENDYPKTREYFDNVAVSFLPNWL